MIDVKLNSNGSVWVVTIQGELTTVSVDEFRKNVAIFMADAGNTHQYVIDLGMVDFIDSAGLGSLLSLVKRVRDMRGDVKLARLQSAPQKLFSVVRAYNHFDVYESVQHAVDSF